MRYAVLPLDGHHVEQKRACYCTTRHQDNLELIGDIFERFERALPRFQEYLKEFASRDLSGRLREALVVYYAELIAHYQDSIKFLRVHPLSVYNLRFILTYHILKLVGWYIIETPTHPLSTCTDES